MHQPGVAQEALRTGQPGPVGLRVADQPQHREAEQRQRPEQPAEQRDGGEDAQPQRVVRRRVVGLGRREARRCASCGCSSRLRPAGDGRQLALRPAAPTPAPRRTARTGGRRPGRPSPTCTQHWVSRSSIIVDMSMNGLTVTRTHPLPQHPPQPPVLAGQRRRRPAWSACRCRGRSSRRCPSRSSPIDGCDSDDCSLSSPSSESFTTARSAPGSRRRRSGWPASRAPGRATP